MKSPYASRIKIYSDGADKASMLEMNANPLVQGLTTNPSLMKKAGVTDYRSFAKEILAQIKVKPISFEVFADDFQEMERQAKDISAWAPNVYAKIPIMNSKGESCIPLVRKLAHEGVKLNVTALMHTRQVIDTCAALKGGAPSIVSVFAGRVADTGRDPIPLMQASLEICKAHGDQIELLWASCREFFNIVQAELVGCHIITAPADHIKKISMLNMDLEKLSLETVQTFKKDSDSAGFKL
jgi:transaldolase